MPGRLGFKMTVVGSVIVIDAVLVAVPVVPPEPPTAPSRIVGPIVGGLMLPAVASTVEAPPMVSTCI